MESFDIIWQTSFFVLLIVIYLINYLVVKSLEEKPPGSQSLFDISIQDTFFVMKCYGSISCTVCFLGRISRIQNLMNYSQFLLTLGCGIYSFGLISMFVSAGCLCIIRTLCIFQMTFLAETVGEWRVRLISGAMTFSLGFLSALVFIVFDDVVSGSPVTLLTNELNPSGKFKKFLYLIYESRVGMINDHGLPLANPLANIE